MNHIDEIQEFLTELTIELSRKTGKGILQANQVARRMGVPVATFSHWLNGNRQPNYENSVSMAVNLAQEMDQDWADRWMDMVGYERVPPTRLDPALARLARIWFDIPELDRDEIVAHAEEAIKNAHNRGKGASSTT